MKRKLLALLMAAAMATGIFTACGGENPTPSANEGANLAEDEAATESSDAPDSESAGEAGQLVLMTNDTTFPGWDTYIQKAEAATGLSIDVITSPSNSTDRLSKITTILSSGDSSVDVIAIDDEMMSQYKAAGFLEPLQDTVMTPEVFAQFQEEYMRERTMNGDDIFSAPMYMEILAFWVDEAKLEAAGLDASPATLEEFMQFVQANSGDGSYGYGGAWEKTYVFNEIGTFVNLFGGDYLDWTNPNSREAIEFMYNLMADGYTPKAQMADQYDPMMQKLIDGTYASHFMYTGGLQTFIDSGKYGPGGIQIAPMPTFAQNAAYMSSWHYVLNKASENKDAAVKFLQWAVSLEGEVAYYEMCSRMPARKDVILDASFDEEPGVAEFRSYIENTTLYARDMAPQAMEFIGAIGSLFQQYISDEITLDEYCTMAQQEVETYMPQ